MLQPDPRNNISTKNISLHPVRPPAEGSHMLCNNAIEIPEFEDCEGSGKLGGCLRLRLEGPPSGQPQNTALPSPAVYSSSIAPPTGTVLSAQESLIASLREELALQRSITTQYAADLDSRDDFIDILCARVEVAEMELEEACAIAEEQYELVRGFWKYLNKLERVVGRIKVNEDMSRQDVQSLRSNRSADADAKIDNTQIFRLMKERDELLEEVARLQRARSNNQEWNEEKDELLTNLAEAEAAYSSNTAKPQTQARGNGNGTLTENYREQMSLTQKELHAQRERTEIAYEELRVLRKENTELKAAVTALQEENGEGAGFEELESMNQELVNRLNDVLAAQQAVEEEHDQVRLSSHSHIIIFKLTCPCIDFRRISFVSTVCWGPHVVQVGSRTETRSQHTRTHFCPRAL
jgi:hypothetical protein